MVTLTLPQLATTKPYKNVGYIHRTNTAYDQITLNRLVLVRMNSKYRYQKVTIRR